MHLDYIRSFCKVVKVKSITKAAGELHLSQPALSLQINCLESRFGTRLLERTNRGVKLTATGELVYRHGQRLLKIIETLDQDLLDARNPAGRKLKISSSPILGSYILPVKMLDFAQTHPENKFSVTIKPVHEVIENLIDKTANIGIIAGPLPPGIAVRLEEEKISINSIGLDAIVAVCHRHSPWSKMEFRLEQVSSLPLILPQKTCGSRSAIDQAFHDMRIKPDQMKIIMELDNCAAIICAVKACAGIGLVPRIAITDTSDIKIMKIPNLVLPLPFNLLVSSTLAKTPAIKELVTILGGAIGDSLQLEQSV